MRGSPSVPQVTSASVDKGPYWNAPLNTNVPGRTAVNPFASQGTAAPGAPATQPPAASGLFAPAQTAQQPQPMQGSPYWTYGAAPQTYFQGNALPNMGWPGQTTGNSPASSPTAPSSNTNNPTGLARGGALSRDQEFRTGSGNHRVSGPGTETSDSIPAMLSNHEYVLDAEDMRQIGGGDPVRGADRLDRDRRNLARGNGVLAQFAKTRRR